MKTFEEIVRYDVAVDRKTDSNGEENDIEEENEKSVPSKAAP